MQAMQKPLVKIVVLGDAGVGKTSLISTAANDTFDARPVPVLPPTRLPAEFTPDHVPMLVTDTSSRPEDQQVTDLVLQNSDVVVVCFDATRPATLDNIRTHWYQRVQSINPGAPVIMACCKADRLSEEREVNALRERVEHAVHDLSHVEVCLNCSAKTLRMVADVFFYALKSVLYPLQPLYDRLEKRLRPLCVRALKRVFVMCDADGDGALNDTELNHFQRACFGMALDETELQNVKQIVASKMPSGVSHRGITLEGFLFLHVLFIERGRLESTWAVLRKFGYNDHVLLSDEVLNRVSWVPAADHVWELSDAALDFLVRQFSAVDDDHDGLISWQQLDALFSTIPPPIWQGEPWSHLLVPGLYGAAHKLEAFLLKWQLHTLVDPRTAYAHLLYLGFGGPDGSGGPALLARGVRRKVDKRHRAELATRTCLQCFVFGPKASGKTSLLRALVGQKPEGPLTPAPTASAASAINRAAAAANTATSSTLDTVSSRASGLSDISTAQQEGSDVADAPAAGVDAADVDSSVGTYMKAAAAACWTAVSLAKGSDERDRTLVLHEVGGELEAQMLTTAALAAHGAPPLVQTTPGAGGPPPLDLSRADVAAFLFDCSNPVSFRQAMDLLVKVSTLAGDALPCVLVATKDELVMSSALETQVQAALSELQLPGLVRCSCQMGDTNNMFTSLVSAAVNPEPWIPETPQRKAHRRFIRQALLGTAVCTGLAGAAYLTYRFYYSNSSSTSTSSSSTTGSSRWGNTSATPPSSSLTGTATSSSTGRSSTAVSQGPLAPSRAYTTSEPSQSTGLLAARAAPASSPQPISSTAQGPSSSVAVTQSSQGNTPDSFWDYLASLFAQLQTYFQKDASSPTANTVSSTVRANSVAEPCTHPGSSVASCSGQPAQLGGSSGQAACQMGRQEASCSTSDDAGLQRRQKFVAAATSAMHELMWQAMFSS